MKTIFLASTLLFFSAAPAFAQARPDSTASDDANRSDSNQHNFGWIGLIGLAGLAGLRRPKSVEHQRMAASGVNVKTV
jgi:MYXO-CTERM domain-containing protein